MNIPFETPDGKRHMVDSSIVMVIHDLRQQVAALRRSNDLYEKAEPSGEEQMRVPGENRPLAGQDVGGS